MFFFEDFVKQIKEFEISPKKDIYVYKLSWLKTITGYCLYLPTMFISAIIFYSNITAKERNTWMLIITIFIFFTGVSFIRKNLLYEISINLKENILRHFKINLEIDDFESITLRNMVVPGGKKFQICLDIVTNEKKQMIIPLIMRKKLEFVGLIRSIKPEIFEIEEENL